jgi:hypothetical protein
MKTHRDILAAAGNGHEPAASFVLGYAWTRGRTRSEHRFEVETMVSTTDRYAPGDDSLPAEHHAVASACRQPCSVAEVAAYLSIPLGVAKVLLGDMATDGLLVVHKTASGHGPDLDLMARVLSGLRRL